MLNSGGICHQLYEWVYKSLDLQSVLSSNDYVLLDFAGNMAVVNCSKFYSSLMTQYWCAVFNVQNYRMLIASILLCKPDYHPNEHLGVFS